MADALRAHLSGGPDLADILAFGACPPAGSEGPFEEVALLVIYAATAGPADADAPGFTLARLAAETGARPSGLVLAAAELVGRGLLEERRREAGAPGWELRLAPFVPLERGDLLVAAVRAFELARASRGEAAG